MKPHFNMPQFAPLGPLGTLAPLALGTILLPLLAACGGGGGGGSDTPTPPPPPPQLTLGGVIRGLHPELPLSLSVAGTTEPFKTSGPSSSNFTFSKTFERGTNYTLTIAKHPRGQLCAITQAGTGALQTSLDTVQIDCHDTVLNDTGIRLAPDGSPLSPDGTSGRDSEADRLSKLGSGELGFDFSRICSSGHEVDSLGNCPASTPFGNANAWTCVRDNLTGLQWLKTPQTELANAAPGALCGLAASAWRWPSVHELLSLVHSGKNSGPAIDSAYFPGTPAEVFLSGEAHRSGATTLWGVDYGNRGITGAIARNAGKSWIRWVAGSSAINDPDTPANAYTRSAAGNDFVVLDKRRALMWLIPASPALQTWDAAVASVAPLNLARPGGYADWRLPNRNELDAMALRSRQEPAIDPILYGSEDKRGEFSQIFWSASPFVLQNGAAATAWAMDFSYGDLSPALKSAGARVIYVRNPVFSAP